MHGDCDRADIIGGIFPYAVLTSQFDTTEPQGSSLRNYEEATTENKLYGSMVGIEHIKGTGPIWALYTAAYLKVFLLGVEQGDYYYDLIYGSSSRALCGTNKVDFMMDDDPECT